MTETNHIAALRKTALDTIEACKERQTKWLEDAHKDPVRAMEWADNMFLNTAYVQVWDEVAGMTECYDTFREIRDAVNFKLFSRAKEGSTSTSQSRNEMDLARLSAWSSVAEAIDKLVRREERAAQKAA
ncbi:hypothetical protein BB934_45315 (plasmid) [Microvirga ossetica]|uniref:Phasin domain-containing protein n=1 Tax=Microvirga ossetica TaxID=1882682 RepID=A0A1B2EZP3_9HYPH|nr:hypothetical protein [Microvirga ossetica]ANY85441.1 hypothetical protein BB934_45315 [Microvirga ossetica]